MGVEVEQISYSQDDGLVVLHGKGYGEGLLLQYALECSFLLKSEDGFFKCTGKVYCRNFAEIFAMILNNELSSFSDNLGACERIRYTPIPSSYNIFIKKMIFLYVFTMPLGFVLEFKYWAAHIVTLVFYAFTGIEMIAEEIEDPFGTDNNDLQLDSIVKNIKANLIEIFKN
jgi:predicted membrane chloride channel (bestrophin family)